MPPTRKVAFVSPIWTRQQHRLMGGALRYADAHPRIIVRGFAPAHDLGTVAREMETWGAEGSLGVLGYDDLDKFLGAFKRPLPLVNTELTDERPGVVALLGDFSAFVDVAVDHLRHLGLRSLAILVLEEGPKVRENLVQTFLHVAKPPNPAKASLVYPADRSHLWNPEMPIRPVPAPLAHWLRELPKPTGILCCSLGGGGYITRCCRELGLRVPEDIAVVAGDDTDLSLASEPTLTSVVLSLETVGSEAMRLLMEMIAGRPPASATVRLRCADLHVRESTGRRPPEICDIAGALECIQENACRGITVGDVIRQTQRVSRVTFHRRFQETVGKTPGQAIRERQLQEVCRLLKGTELPVGMVSDLCGFSSPKVLARAFRAVEKTTLRDYRQRHQRASRSVQAETQKRSA
jgi:DNA-binding LacI/PurR family transcriptional regulator/AraC-like DNA-binding protein